MYELKQLIEVAKKGAVLRHPAVHGLIFINESGFIKRRQSGLISGLDFIIGMFDNRWEIATPHPGACTECRGLGWIEIVDHEEGECERCEGSGTEPPKCERCSGTGRIYMVYCNSGGIKCTDCDGKGIKTAHPKKEEPEVFEVRVTKDAFGYLPGEVYSAKLVSGECYQMEGRDVVCPVKSTEIIPEYNHETHRLMNRDEPVRTGDKSYYDGKWHNAGFACYPYEQDRTCIYIRPLPEAPECPHCKGRGGYPDNSLDCAYCGGTGKLPLPEEPIERNFDICNKCGGSGRLYHGASDGDGRRCPHCSGKGRIPEEPQPKPPLVKPPIGIMPKRLHNITRMVKLSEAIERYMDRNKPVPEEWMKEYNELSVEMQSTPEEKKQ